MNTPDDTGNTRFYSISYKGRIRIQTSVDKWPRSGQKPQKGLEKKKLARRICGRILPEVADKRLKKIFLRVSYFIVMTTSQRQRQSLIIILN